MKTILALSLVCFALTGAAAPFLAPTNPPPKVALGWDTVPGTASYNIYFGVGSGQYTNVVNVGNTNVATVTLPARGVTYFFVATDIDTNGLESSFSSEVSFTPKLPPPSPNNMRQPLTLTVQVKQSVQDFQWADAGMNWSIDPTQTAAAYRLQLALAPPIVAPSITPQLRTVQLPPMPGQ